MSGEAWVAKTTTRLKHVPTGEIYPYNESLAMADDMIAIGMDGEAIQTPPPEPEPPVKKPRSKKAELDLPELSLGLGGLEHAL